MGTIVKVALGIVLGFLLLSAGWLVCWGVVMAELKTQRHTTAPPTGLTVLLHDVEHEGSSTYIVGSAQNNAGGDLRYASVRFDLKGEDGTPLGTATDSTTNLAAGALWQFRALVRGVEGEFRYELGEVQAW